MKTVVSVYAVVGMAFSLCHAAVPGVVCPGTNDFTLSCWFKLEKGQKGGNVVVEKNGGGWVQLIVRPYEVRFWTGTTHTDFAHTVRWGRVAPDIWHHLVSTNDRDGDTTLYFDGHRILDADLRPQAGVDVGARAEPVVGPFDGQVRDLRLETGLWNEQAVRDASLRPPEPPQPSPVRNESVVFDYRTDGSFGKHLCGTNEFTLSRSLVSTNAFTVSMWVYFPEPKSCSLLEARQSFSLMIWSDMWKFFTAVPNGMSAPFARRPYIYAPYVNSHKWMNLVATYDGAELRVFTNGLGGKPVEWACCPPVAGDLVLGRGMNGWLGRVTFDDYALGEDEILFRYKREIGNFSDYIVRTLVNPLRYTGVEGRAERLPLDVAGDRSAKVCWRILKGRANVVASGIVCGDWLEVPALPVGKYTLEFFPEGLDSHDFIRRSEYTVIGQEKPAWTDDVLKTPRKLVAAFDPDGAYGPDVFHHTGKTNLVHANFGTYLEALEGGRLAYRFKVDKTKAHLLSFEYPDDKRRDILLGDALGYNMNAGFAVGGEDAPNSGGWIRKSFLFYPQQDDCTLLVYTKHADCPVAIGKVRVFELETPPPGERIECPSDGGRMLGHAWEDGAIQGSYGLSGLSAKELELLGYGARIGRMMAWQGCNVLRWVNWWYGGAHYRSRVCDEYDSHIAGDSTRMMRGLAPFGVMAQPNFNPLTWPPLLQQAGEINQVRRDGTVQRNTGEWNAAPSGVDFCLPGPVFNPADAVVRKSILDSFREASLVWEGEKNYVGPSIEWNLSTTYWFGSLESGYNKSLIESFEREHGCRVSSADELLTPKYREKWIAFRCGIVTDLFKEIVRIVRDGHPERSVTVSMEAGLVLGFYQKERTMDDIIAGKISVLDLWREGGVDFEALNGIDGLNIEWKWIHSANRRWARGKSGWRYFDEEIWSHDRRFRDFAGRVRNPSVWSMIRYWENFNDAPSPGFWWKREYRNHGGAVLGGVHTMKPYVRAVADLDALTLVVGGIVNPNMNDEIAMRRFAHAFRALPKKRLDTVSGSTESVVVRQGVCDGHGVWYAVNCEARVIDVVVRSVRGEVWRQSLPPYSLQTFKTEGAISPLVQVDAVK